MDFFEHQAKANKASSYLIISYLLALCVITVGFNVAGLIVWTFVTQPILDIPNPDPSLFESVKHLLALWFESRFSWQVTCAVFLFIGIISFSNWLGLRQGGGSVAKMMGGRKVPSNTHNTDEKRLLNVVEEMALASGLPVPEVFVMDREDAINAFAAGYSPNEAAVCVTRGLLISLTRDELQGVVGHEFSHILNGDMRINIRLISIMAGLVAAGQLGRWLIEIGFRGGSHDSRGGALFLIIPGILIWIVGSLGVLASRIIKAAISRQREFLADASAVQFTRQTQGIASALYKIANHRHSSLLHNRHAEDLSHMCFAKTLNVQFASMMATHPPIEERIERVDRSFLTKANIRSAQARQSTTQFNETTSLSEVEYRETRAAGFDSGTTQDSLYGKEISQDEMIEFSSPFQDQSVERAIATIGLTDQHNIEAAQECLSSMPSELLTGLHQPEYAPLIVLTLLANANSAPEQARELLKKHSPAHFRAIVDHYQLNLQQIERQPIYPLLQLAMATLKTLTNEERANTLSLAKQLIASDKQIHPEELFLYLVLHRHLNRKASRRQKIEFSSFDPIKTDLIKLLSFLCHFTETEQQEAAYNKAIGQFSFDSSEYIKAENIKHDEVANAIFRIEHLAPLLKRSVLMSVVDLMSHDHDITHQELDWLRMLADCWDCPIPMTKI